MVLSLLATSEANETLSSLNNESQRYTLHIYYIVRETTLSSADLVCHNVGRVKYQSFLNW